MKKTDRPWVSRACLTGSRWSFSGAKPPPAANLSPSLKYQLPGHVDDLDELGRIEADVVVPGPDQGDTSCWCAGVDAAVMVNSQDRLQARQAAGAAEEVRTMVEVNVPGHGSRIEGRSARVNTRDPRRHARALDCLTGADTRDWRRGNELRLCPSLPALRCTLESARNLSTEEGGLVTGGVQMECPGRCWVVLQPGVRHLRGRAHRLPGRAPS